MRTFFYVIFKKFSFRFEQNALFKRDKSEREKDLCSYLMVGEEVNSMEQSSSYDEKTVMHQFDRKCKLALKGEIVDYERHLAYLRKHETLFSELSEQEMESLSIFDTYNRNLSQPHTVIKPELPWMSLPTVHVYSFTQQILSKMNMVKMVILTISGMLSVWKRRLNRMRSMLKISTPRFLMQVNSMIL